MLDYLVKITKELKAYGEDYGCTVSTVAIFYDGRERLKLYVSCSGRGNNIYVGRGYSQIWLMSKLRSWISERGLRKAPVDGDALCRLKGKV